MNKNQERMMYFKKVKKGLENNAKSELKITQFYVFLRKKNTLFIGPTKKYSMIRWKYIKKINS